MDTKLIRLSDGATLKDSAVATEKIPAGAVLLNPMKHAYDPVHRRLRPLSTAEQIDALTQRLASAEARLAALEAQIASDPKSPA